MENKQLKNPTNGSSLNELSKSEISNIDINKKPELGNGRKMKPSRILVECLFCHKISNLNELTRTIARDNKDEFSCPKCDWYKFIIREDLKDE